jgi:hypothetical protein
MMNLDTARINKRFNFSLISQQRIIEQHSNYTDSHHDRTSHAYGLKSSYGLSSKKMGLEFGIKFGLYDHYHWDYKDGSSTEYLPST